MAYQFVYATPGSALWEAANQGNLERLKQELAKPGADIEVCDRMRRTPLVEAAKYNHPECVKELLLAGANPEHVAFMGKAIDYTDNSEIEEMLEEASAARARGEKWVPKNGNAFGSNVGSDNKDDGVGNTVAAAVNPA